MTARSATSIGGEQDEKLLRRRVRRDSMSGTMVMRRRSLIIALGLSVINARSAFAQVQPRVRLIGWLTERDTAVDAVYAEYLDAFKAGMRELGYVEGKDYKVEERSAGGDPGRLQAMAAELVARKVELILTTVTLSALAARRATRNIPIITTSAGDPVGSGLAASLSHPGGNVTGLTSISAELYAKRLDLMRQIMPAMRRVGYLYNPDNPVDQLGLKRFEAACAKINCNVLRAQARKNDDIRAAFKVLTGEKVQAVIVTSSSMLGLRATIVKEAAMSRLPAIYARSVFAETGGLISYGPDYKDMHRHAAIFVDKVLRGAKPGDLPIEQPTKYELVVNLKTARTLGIKMPDVIMLRADKVIE
jgi:putative ABC transport system substrate-binding protein